MMRNNEEEEKMQRLKMNQNDDAMYYNNYTPTNKSRVYPDMREKMYEGISEYNVEVIRQILEKKYVFFLSNDKRERKLIFELYKSATPDMVMRKEYEEKKKKSPIHHRFTTPK